MSRNVFADIGLPDPETHLAQAKIVQASSRIIAEKGLTQAEAGARLGLSQPKVCALLHGQECGYSIERMLRFVTALNHNALNHNVHLTMDVEGG